MELTWWLVAILGMVALAVCVAAALLWPRSAAQRVLRPLANVERLTRLPEYRRAVRMRTAATIAAVALLLMTVVAAVVAASRPTGGPTLWPYSDSAAPEDIMVCIGAPLTDPATAPALRFFADAIPTFGTERIGLTSANRRVVPLTRDYQYAAAQFADYGRPVEQQGDSPAFVRPVSYADYALTLPDLLGLCLTGFPHFDEPSAQRRSLIYIGPGTLSDAQPSLFSAAQLTELASRGGIQVNSVVTSGDDAVVAAISEATGGRTYPADDDVPQRLADIRSHPPGAPVEAQAGPVRAIETPDVPLTVALIALLALALWPVVMPR
ncbi:hypothetical protein [Mycobacterium sp. ACS4331]|uniref:hypothetical protein n=1 Tax=Mycobacterium sp. ACS4331 TaxID=1834121 RepID=UPI00080106F8|nr:hypothetical protein [Mycobacterium sp. ACS4331]OBF13397.1 hypothetical protein A5727_17225 [Mycobacterium sp. ACS4331]